MLFIPTADYFLYGNNKQLIPHSHSLFMIPRIGKEQARQMDALMPERFLISPLLMMEQAGYRLAEFVRAHHFGKRVLVCCGKGNNGADGLAAARHLHNFGFSPHIWLLEQPTTKEGKQQMQILEKIDVDFVDTLMECDVILDCMLGYNLSGEPREPYAAVIHQINAENVPIVSCDVPSGVDADKGPGETYVRASHVLGLGLPKIGVQYLDCHEFAADIGVVPELYEQIDVDKEAYFDEASIRKVL